MKIGICTIAFRDKLLDAALDAAAALKTDGVELWGREPHLSESFDENRVRLAAAMVRNRGLELPILGSYYRPGATSKRDDNRVGMSATLHTARCLHTPLVRIWASDVGSDRAGGETWQRTVQETRATCDLATDLNITLAAEMHPDTLCDTGASSRRFVEMVDRPNLRLNFQVAVHDLNETVEERMAQVLPWIVHVHAQNYVQFIREGEVHKQAPLADGCYDYTAILGALRDAGYGGYVMVEFAFREGEARLKALAEDIQFLRSIVR